MNLFLFHRDFRIEDNLALNALSQHGPVTCLFIFTPTQLTKNPFYSSKSFGFMCASLYELKHTLQEKGADLYFKYGDTLEILKGMNIKRIGFNLDYTPYARRRAESIVDYAREKGIECITAEDYLLRPMGTFLKANKTPYVVFTPFKTAALKYPVDKPEIINIEFAKMDGSFYTPEYTPTQIKGGRKAGKKLLHFNYQHDDFTPTTGLSPYLKFGCVSIREAYWATTSPLFRSQLYWREFFYYIACYFPKVLDDREDFKEGLPWRNAPQEFERWCQGRTGFPIVDAAMRQLNETGYMHNRGRLITANFLTRLLGIDWRLGETYFATHLIDYDPCVNNGNWQWVAGTGVDRAPYSQRIFNPWYQGLSHDADAKYIKQWIPELRDISPHHIHRWDKHHTEAYLTPMIDYVEARKRRILVVG
jgi:deoxyribodipyrimidine photo-lyase